MPREATLPPRVVNVPGDYFSMAGFEVTLYGRIWVSAEDKAVLHRFAWFDELECYAMLLSPFSQCDGYQFWTIV